MRKVDLVVFDMAGTTVRDLNEVENCFMQAAEKTGLNAPTDRIIAMMGWSKKLVFQTLWEEQLMGMPQNEIDKKVDASYQIFCEVLENHYLTNTVFPVDGCLDVFTQLKSKGIKIALTTGFYRKVTNIILARLGWELGLDANYLQTGNGLIDCSVASDEVSMGRPAPLMIFKAMDKLNIIDPARVVNIGDTPSDLESGNIAKVGFNIGVSYGTHTFDQLTKYKHDRIIGDIRDVLQFIED
jgi:phosphonatase-like hydrolase